MGDTDAETERVAGRAPTGGEFFDSHLHRRGHPRPTQAGVGAGNRDR